MNKESGLLFQLLEKQEFKQWVINPNEESNYFWQKWMDQSEERRAAALSAREIILRIRFKKNNLDGQYQETLLKEIIHGSRQLRTGVRKRSTAAYWRVAAMIALLLASGVVYQMVIRITPTPTAEVAEPQNMVVRINPPGQKSTIHLPDGSVVNLNANSTLRYFNDFTTDRFLEIEGEAYFTVERDTERPFRVSSGELTTTALGTAFNVNTRGDTEKIILVEGKVKVVTSSNGASEVLHPREAVSYQSLTGLSEKQHIASLNEVRWTDGVIYFKETTLREVIRVLEDWYAVEIDVEGDYNQLTYSGEFQHEYLSNILQAMQFSLGLDYEINGKHVQLKIK